MSLSTLPTELIVHVFKSVNDLGSAAALSRTSRDLHTIWRYSLASICNAVLPRMVECYDEACLLLEATTTSTIVASRSSVENKAQAAISRAQMLFTNARLAQDALTQFEIEVATLQAILPEHMFECACAGKGRDKRGFDRVHILEGYYRAVSITHLVGKGETTLRQQILATMRLLDFLRMSEILEWLDYLYSQGFLPRDDDIPLSGYESLEPGGYLRVEEDWVDISEALNILYPLHDKIAKKSERMIPINDHSIWGSFYDLFLHGDCLKAGRDKARNVTLADLLPQLPK